MAYTCPICGSVSQDPNDEANRYCGRCHIFADDIKSPVCPRCGKPPGMLMSPVQAFCTSAVCNVLSWNVTRTPEQNAADINLIDLGGFDTRQTRHRHNVLADRAEDLSRWAEETGAVTHAGEDDE